MPCCRHAALATSQEPYQSVSLLLHGLLMASLQGRSLGSLGILLLVQLLP